MTDLPSRKLSRRSVSPRRRDTCNRTHTDSSRFNIRQNAYSRCVCR